jgi:hypothetical protein
MNSNKFYTYAYLRPDRVPYYIGKGHGNRMYKKGRKGTNPPEDSSLILVLKSGMSEEEALKHEVYMIHILGRKDQGKGPLWNFTDGGEGLSNPSDEIRNKISRSKKGKPGGMLGRKLTDEQKEKISKALKGRVGHGGMAGRNHSEETKRKMSEAFKESGRKPPVFNKPHTEETKRKISEKKKGVKHTPEQNAAKSERQKGKKRGPYKKINA